MRHPTLRRTISIAALLPLLLFAATASARSVFRCRMAGLVSDACCCPPAADGAGGAPMATLAGDACCQHDVIAGDRTPVEVAPRATDGEASPVLMAATCLAPSRPRIPSQHARARAVDAAAPPLIPLILAKHSRLI